MTTTLGNMQNLKHIADRTIPKPNKREFVVNENGTTDDIMATILYSAKHDAYQLKDFAPYLQGKDLEASAYNTWKFLKDHIRYIVDPMQKQTIKSPSAIWHVYKSCDCKGYTSFAGGIMNHLGYDVYQKYVSFEAGKPVSHVYLEVPNKKKVSPSLSMGYSMNLTTKNPTYTPDATRLKQPKVKALTGFANMSKGFYPILSSTVTKKAS